MHIALIISSLAPGGAERVLSELANAWVSRGHKVTIMLLAAPNTSSLYSLDSKVHLIHIGYVPQDDLSLLSRLKHIIRRTLKLRKAFKVFKPDVIVSFLDVVNVTTLLATRLLGIPVIVSERTHPYYHYLPRFYRILRKMTYPWADRVICQTDSASAYFSSLPESKKDVISNIVKKPSMQKEVPDILRPVQEIVSVGRLDRHKDFKTLILAFSLITHEIHPDLKLFIYGEGPERTNLEKLIKEFGLTNRIFLPGIVKKIHEAIYKADLFTFPSRYEGFPNAVCEAMALGLPVIASNCSGNIDIIREGVDGRFFPVADAPRLGEVILELIKDPHQRVKLSRGALAICDRFSEKSILQKWDEVLGDVRSSKKGEDSESLDEWPF